MIKNLNDSEPLIKINWRKLWRYFKAFLSFIVWLIKEILKVILKILTFVVILIYKSYLGLRKFCKSNVKGFQVVLLIIGFLIILFFLMKQVFSIQNKKDQEYKRFKKIKNEQIDNLLKEKKEMKKEMRDLKDKLTYQNQTSAVLASGWSKVSQLPKNVKETIAKYSKIYNVNRPLVECVVANESGGRYDAVGDNSLAVGVSQYYLPTFLAHRRQLGKSEEDLRMDVDASIEAMCFSISRGGIGNWSARVKCI